MITRDLMQPKCSRALFHAPFGTEHLLAALGLSFVTEIVLAIAWAEAGVGTIFISLLAAATLLLLAPAGARRFSRRRRSRVAPDRWTGWDGPVIGLNWPWAASLRSRLI